MTVAIQAIDLTKAFGQGQDRTVAVANVSFEVEEGQFVVLMGPSGSGKSTLLAMLSGLLRPDTGTVLLRGEPIWAGTDREREEFRRCHCGFIFQHYNLFPALTAQQQVEIALEWGSEVPREEVGGRAKEILGLLGLPDKLNLKPHQLSGGEKQRVAVGRALAKRPQLLFADEPTAALDWKNGEHVLDLLWAAARRFETTVLLVSHDPRVMHRADRVLRLEDGQLCGSESPQAEETTMSAGKPLIVP